MRFKTKVKLLIILLAVMAASLIAGCSVGEISIDDFLQEHGAKNQTVTYYANGGSFSGGISSIPVKYMYFRENVCITSDFGKEKVPVSRSGYIFKGWYYVELDADGNPVYADKENEIVQSTGTEVDFTRKIQKDEHWYVCAEWERDVYVSYVLVCDGGFTVTGSDGKGYKDGDEIYTKNFGTGGTATVNGTTVPKESKNATFLQMYYDRECTRPIESYGQISRPADGVEKVEVYAKYIRGKYTVVRDSAGVASMFNLNSYNDTAFYFFNTDKKKEIDCKNVDFYPKNDAFNCRIEGNGFTLVNLSFKQDYISGGNSYSMLGTLGDTASISNLTLKNVTVTMSLRNNNTTSALYLVSLGMSDEAKLDGFVIDGVEMEISCPNATDKITNLIYDPSADEYSGDSLMFGGFDGTDEQFLAAHTGIEVKNYKLTVKVGGQTVLEKNNQEAE